MSDRRLGRMGMIGGAVAALALLAGMPGARADELSELRTNNRLLQQKLDQIQQEQAAPADGSAATGAPGGSFPRSFLVPGTDTSVRIGGDVTETFDYTLQGGR